MIIYFILLDERAAAKKTSSDWYSIKVAVAVIVKIDKTIWPKIEDWMCGWECVLVRIYFGSMLSFLSFLCAKNEHVHGFHETGTNRYYIISISCDCVENLTKIHFASIEHTEQAHQHGYLKSKLSHYSVTLKSAHSTQSLNFFFRSSILLSFVFNISKKKKVEKKDEEVPISSRISITPHIQYALTQCSIRWY